MKWFFIGVLLILLACSEPPSEQPKKEVTAPSVNSPIPSTILENNNDFTTGIVADGTFVSRASRVKGDVVVERLVDQSYKLTFSNFEATRTENMLLVLTKNQYVISSKDIGDYYEIGKVKGEIKNQFYFFPRSVNVTQYSSLSLIQQDNRIVEASAVLSFLE